MRFLFRQICSVRRHRDQGPQHGPEGIELAPTENRVDRLDPIHEFLALVPGHIACIAHSELPLSGSVEATTDEEFDRAMALNLKSTFLACRAVIPAMRKAKRGKIVNVSSESSLLGEAESFLYSAGKSGVNRLTESLARELNTANIQVNCVMPRILDTPANRKAMPDADFSSWVKTDQVARVILWLCSEDADPITGSSIPVYGGP